MMNATGNPSVSRTKYLTAYTPYGYRKSDEDKHRLVVDEEAAAVVREIYRMRYSGMAYGKIAAALNEKGILSPPMVLGAALREKRQLQIL